MIIDLHFHTNMFSPCSSISLEEGICRAHEVGLDGICITEHDCIGYYPKLSMLERRYGVKIFIGVEILTIEGDLLCFGLDRLPGKNLRAKDLTNYLYRLKGATIAAHPFHNERYHTPGQALDPGREAAYSDPRVGVLRPFFPVVHSGMEPTSRFRSSRSLGNNDRGMGEYFLSLPRLSAVEGYNGNTSNENNLRAVELAGEAGLSISGGSDAHTLDDIGFYATEFGNTIQTVSELITALRAGDIRPVKCKNELEVYA